MQRIGRIKTDLNSCFEVIVKTFWVKIGFFAKMKIVNPFQKKSVRSVSSVKSVFHFGSDLNRF